MGLGTKPTLRPTWLQVSQPKATSGGQPAEPAGEAGAALVEFAVGLEGEVGGPEEQR